MTLHPDSTIDFSDLEECDGPGIILEHSGVDINTCLHCRSCSGGCPFTAAMDYLPNEIIRLLQFGMIEAAMGSATIWTCVACNTCSAQCPMAIDIPAAMDVMKQMAVARKIVIAEPDVLDFHREILRSITKYGRTHKLEIMLRFKLKTRRYFSDFQTGLRMLAKRKLDLTPSRIQDTATLKRLMNGLE
ncbi:MAG: 4Fe-4S dicluster domain-containing protein [Desulfosarcina sp.]